MLRRDLDISCRRIRTREHGECEECGECGEYWGCGECALNYYPFVLYRDCQIARGFVEFAVLSGEAAACGVVGGDKRC